jgi:photosystem II stability/assembly factor-like uncharacterized protein
MTQRSTASMLRRLAALAAVAVSLCLPWVVAPRAAAATSPWTEVTAPWDSSWAINDIYAFGDTGLAAAGDGGHVAVTLNGGDSWHVVVPQGLEDAAFTAVAFDASGHGVVASGGRLLTTADGGASWQPPTFVGPGLGAAVNDVAIAGSVAIAVGDNGVVLRSGDAGVTWHEPASPTTASITCVAIAGDGTAVAGADSGVILVGRGDDWTVAGSVAGAVTSVAASTDAVLGDGSPALFAAGGHTVLGSDDGHSFAAVAGLPDLTAGTWGTVAWAGVPGRSLLIADTQEAAFYEAVPRSWLPGPTGLGGTSRAVAPGGQSVAYLLGSDGRLVRTLSSGREPASLELSRKRIPTGGSTRLTTTVRVGAPGDLRLRRRVPGRAWETAQTLPWTSADWGRETSFDLSPSLSQEYLLEFKYGGTVTELAPAVTVQAVPKIVPAHSRLVLRRGAIYRFSGTVTPVLLGESVELYTDRGRGWRPVSLQGSVSLQGGRVWTSRRFGTPRAETYHLRAHLRRTQTHAEAWSPVVTVTIR